VTCLAVSEPSLATARLRPENRRRVWCDRRRLSL